MKHLFSLLFCFGLLSGLHAQNLPSYLPANGLVGWWPFNGNAQDESGNGNHGSINGAISSSDRFYSDNSSFEYHVNSYIEIPNSNSLQIGNAASFSVWLKYVSLSSGLNWILQKGIGGGCPQEGFYMTFDDGFGPKFNKGLVYGSGANYCSTVTNIGLDLDTSWHHLVSIYNPPNGHKLYFDGVEVELDYAFPCSNCTIINSPGRPLFIGNSPSDGGTGWNGKLDDIAIYNRALTQEEITQLYQAGNETSLSYQLAQQKLGNCPTSPVKLSVQTSVKVKTDSAGSIGSSSAMAYGNILNDGGKTITRRGFCWGTSANPTLSNSFSENGSGSGAFSGSLSGLSPSTSYFLRAYAGTPTEVWYGNEITFTTSSGSVSSATCGTPNIHNPNLSYGTMTDQDGNSYKTIVIGTQEWMAENLKTGHYRNGDVIPVVADNTAWSESTTGASCWYNNDSAAYDCPYGRFYNWYTVADPRGLCPAGWHVPSDEEWTSMVNFIGGSGFAGVMMKADSTRWSLNFRNQPKNNVGFSGLPSSYRVSAGSFGILGESAQWWCSGDNSWTRYVIYYEDNLTEGVTEGGIGLAIRCIKNSVELGNVLELNCANVSNSGSIIEGVPVDAAVSIIPCNAIAGSYNGRKFLSYGVTGLTATLTAGNLADGDNNLTFNISGTPTGNGNAYFDLEISGNNCLLTRVVISSIDGPTSHFCGAQGIHNANLNYGIITDQEGNSYKTVVIGTQEWMAENLKTKYYRNGDTISNRIFISNTRWRTYGKGAFSTYSYDEGFSCPFGRLYNWYAIADQRGLCPIGWHIPTDSEWSILEEYLGGSSLAGGKMKTINNFSQGSGIWYSPSSGSNSSGFSALPGGNNFSGFAGMGKFGSWWSSSENIANQNEVWYRYIGFISNECNKFSTLKNYISMSVRCLKD